MTLRGPRIRIERIDHPEAIRNRSIRLAASISFVLFIIFAEFVSRPLLELFRTPSGSLCPLLNITGIPCPFCGLTRSLSSLLRGNIPEAFRYHPFGPALWGGTTLLVILSLGLVRMRKRITIRAGQSWTSFSSAVVFFFFVSFGNILFGHH